MLDTKFRIHSERAGVSASHAFELPACPAVFRGIGAMIYCMRRLFSVSVSEKKIEAETCTCQQSIKVLRAKPSWDDGEVMRYSNCTTLSRNCLTTAL
jgi:hypothetical protein